MSSFVRQPLEQKLNRQNMISRIKRLESKTGARASASVNDLGEIADKISAAKFYAVDVDKNVVRMIMSGESLIGLIGVDAHLAGMADDGTVQFYVDAATGKIYWGSGAGVLDSDGMSINIDNYDDTTNPNAIRFLSSGTEASRIVAWQNTGTLNNYAATTVNHITGLSSNYRIDVYGSSTDGAAINMNAQGVYQHLLKIDASLAGIKISRITLNGGPIAKIGGIIFDHYANVGNVGTGEDDLYSDTLDADTFVADGDKVTASYMVTMVAHATATRRIRIYLGGTSIYDTAAITIAGGLGYCGINVEMIRESSTVVRCSVTASGYRMSATVPALYTRVTGLTLTNTNILKITGEAAGVGAATDDLIARTGTVYWYPAA